MAYIKGKQLADGTIVNSKIQDATIEASKLAGSVPASKLDLTGSFDFASGTVSVADPTQDSHAANKRYVDSVKQALDIKESVRVASSDSLNNENASTSFTYSNGVFTEDSAATAVVTLDGVQLASGNRVLLKNESTGANNGIYEVTTVGNGSTIAWVLTRASDFDSDEDISAGAFCFVEEGTENGDSGFVLTTDETITLGTTALTFTQFSGAGQVIAGDGISKSGNTVSVDLDSDSGLSVSASGLKIDASQLADGTIAIAADELVFIDADGGTKRESVADFSTAIAGNGLSSTNGALEVATFSNGGLNFTTGELQVNKADSSLSSDASGLKVNLNAEGSIAIKGAAGLAAPILATADLKKNPNSVTADATSTGITISATPAADGAVRVFVNGVAAELGILSDKTLDCYFSADGGTTARAMADIASGDTLYWNGASAYALETDDVLDIVYAKIS